MLVYDRTHEMIDWAAERVQAQFRPDAVPIGWAAPDGTLRAVTVFDGFSECDCNMHIASDGTRRWLTRGYMRAAFAYPFMQLPLRRVTGLVPASNRAALEFDLRLGFEYEGLCRDALPADDIVILGMRRTCCPFIPERYRHVQFVQRPGPTNPLAE